MSKEFANIRELLESYVQKELSEKLSENQRAAYIWNMANGDIERAHTTGVYLKEGKRGNAPILGVYLDSRPRVIDFSANKELYLIRLENQGLEISDIEFRVTKHIKKKQPDTDISVQNDSKQVLPELTEEEEKLIRELIKDIPDTLYIPVYETVCLSYRREKLKKQAENKN